MLAVMDSPGVLSSYCAATLWYWLIVSFDMLSTPPLRPATPIPRPLLAHALNQPREWPR
jgi:hypothetical protein